MFLLVRASLAISDVGSNRALEISVLVLDIICPVAIMLIVPAFLRSLTRRSRLVYPVCALFAGGINIDSEMPALVGPMAELPFYGSGL